MLMFDRKAKLKPKKKEKETMIGERWQHQDVTFKETNKESNVWFGLVDCTDRELAQKGDETDHMTAINHTPLQH